MIRTAIGTSVQYANVTFPAHVDINLTIALGFFLTNIVGLPANILIIYLSFCVPSITGHFKYFLANLALCDLGICVTVSHSCIFHLWHVVAGTPMTATKCTVGFIYTFAFAMCMTYNIPLASANRYMVIVHGKDHWFTKKVE